MKTLVYINFILTLVLIGVVVWLFTFNKPKEIVTQIRQDATDSIQYIDKCGEDCKKQIEEIIAKNTVTPTETVKTITITPAPVKAKAQTAYIPIGGPITTTSSDWYDAPGTEFYLDYNNDYGKTAYADWQAFLKVADGNGIAYARLYDITNKIGVNGSEVSVTNKGDLTQVISGRLNFWSGNNQYRVQIKSLNKFEVTFGSGRIKIIY
ncbi:MAG: hypothetical protein AAB778_02340 [Patescibacteria group bacterium]